MFLWRENNQDLNVPAHLLILFYPGVLQMSPSSHCNSTQPFLPIQTSPNCPLPSFLISCRDSRGISHISLVFTDKSASLGIPRLQLPIKRQHSPAALSERERRQTDRRRKEETRERERKQRAEVAYREIKTEQDRLLMRLCNWQVNQKHTHKSRNKQQNRH